MSMTVVSVYDRLPDAEGARTALLEAGFDAASVHLTAHEDEAGAMKSNFTVGNSDTGLNDDSGLFDAGKDNDTYAHDYADPKRPGSITLIVDASDDRQSKMASDILQRHGATRVAANAAGTL